MTSLCPDVLHGSGLNQEILTLQSKLGLLTKERNLLQEALGKLEGEKLSTGLSEKKNNFESRLTETNSVIQHLQKELEAKRERIILEESPEEDETSCDQSPTCVFEVSAAQSVMLPNINMGNSNNTSVTLPPQLQDTSVSPNGNSTSNPLLQSPDTNSNTLLVEGKSPTESGKWKPGKPPVIPENLHYENDKCPVGTKPLENVNGGSATVHAKEDKLQDTRMTVQEVVDNMEEKPSRTDNITPMNESLSQIKRDGGEKHRKSKTRRKKLHHQQHFVDSNDNPNWEEMSPSEDPVNGTTVDPDEAPYWANRKKTGNKKTLSGSNPAGRSKTGSNAIHCYKDAVPPLQHNRTGMPICDCCENQLIPPEKPPRLSQPDNLIQFASLRNEVAQIREEHFAIRDTLARKEGELHRTKYALENIAQERDFLKKKVIELECLLKQSPKTFSLFSSASPQPESHQSDLPSPCKMAERVKLSQHKVKKADSTCTCNNGTETTDPRTVSLHHSNCHRHHHHMLQNSDSTTHANSVSSPSRHPRSPGSPYLPSADVETNPLPDSSPGKSSQSSGRITGHDLSTIGPSCNSRIMEHLLQPIQDESMVVEMQEVLLADKSDADTRTIIQEKFYEFQIHTDRLQSRVEHLRSQNDVLALNLEDAKSHSDRLTVLLGRYESNNIGHQITLNLSDQLIDAYDVLVALLESELGLLLANCRAAGIGAPPPTSPCSGNFTGCQDDIDVASLLQRANDNRMTAEIAARNLIIRMVDSPGSENNNSMANMLLPMQNHHQGNVPPWEDASSGSQTMSSASSVGASSNHSHTPSASSGPSASRGASIEKNEESRVRDYIIQLKTEREGVRGTLVDLENWSLEPVSPERPITSPCDILEARKMDLETAVLMQELMAMREDRAELRAQLFLMDKEKSSLEYRLGGYDAQLDAYRARIKHLNAELSDLQQSVTNNAPGAQNKDTTAENMNRSSPHQLEGNVNNNNVTEDRETVLKKRIHELASSLEKITYNANLREHQSTETVNELKKANRILVENLENVKKKYQNRVKKMEEQILSIMEKHSLQMKLYKDRLNLLELELMERHHNQ